MSIPTLEDIAKKSAIRKFLEESHFKEAQRTAEETCRNAQKKINAPDKPLTDLPLFLIYRTLIRAETELQNAGKRCSGYIDDIACSLVFAQHLAIGSICSSESSSAKTKQHDVYYYAGRHNLEAFHRNKTDMDVTGFKKLAEEYLRKSYNLWKEIKSKKKEAFRYARFAHTCFLLYRLESKESEEIGMLKEAVENIKVAQEILQQTKKADDRDYGKMSEIAGSVLVWAHHRQKENSWKNTQEERYIMENKTELEKTFLYCALRGKVLEEAKPAKFKYREA